MGLRQDVQIRHRASRWLLPALLVIVVLALQAGGDTARLALQYDREMIAAGEVFRLLTGHIVHLGWPHLVLNVVGLLLVWFLVGSAHAWWRWLAIIAASAAIIDIGFWYLIPRLEWYVGLSGVLHGVLAAGVVGLWSSRRNEALILAIALVFKLLYESVIGPLPGSENTAGGIVITEAHLFGALGGGISALIFVFGERLFAET
ncbi:MAG: rhombosortase [Gammaproteobacteria bacterium]|nr:rhombosortase [Gammaproteobacteria bacterium]